MVKNRKCLEYYLDSKTYSNEDILKSIEETKKDFQNKEIEVRLELNEWGVYVIRFEFKDKDNYMISFKTNKVKPLMKINKKRKRNVKDYYGARKYGEYKSSSTYRPL